MTESITRHPFTTQTTAEGFTGLIIWGINTDMLRLTMNQGNQLAGENTIPFLQKKRKQLSLQQFNAKELFIHNWVCGIFYDRKAVACLLLNRIAVSFSFWLHPIMCCSVLWRELRSANSFPFIHNSNFIQNAKEQ